jgi:glycylpeptide N-tetradecanoyltransferase
MKLFDIGFSGLPHGSTPARQVAKNRVPTAPTVPGLRPMESKDVKEVQILLKRYLKQFDIAPEYTEAEIEHWLVNRATTPSEQVVWSYVVEDPKTKKITDFFSFYMLESRVIGNAKYDTLKAAYLFYYATESALGKEKDVRALKERLNALIVDALVIAKQVCFLL